MTVPESVLSPPVVSRSQVGFTLIELLVSITLLILIIGGGLATYVKFNDKETLVTNGQKLMQYMVSAQKKARDGNLPNGCQHLQSYSVVAASVSAAVVSLNAVCSNTTVTVSSFTHPSTIQPTTAINVQFSVLGQGVINGGNLVYGVSNGSHSYTFGIGIGGNIGTITYN